MENLVYGLLQPELAFLIEILLLQALLDLLKIQDLSQIPFPAHKTTQHTPYLLQLAQQILLSLLVLHSKITRDRRQQAMATVALKGQALILLPNTKHQVVSSASLPSQSEV